jgi:hypothetical protein
MSLEDVPAPSLLTQVLCDGGHGRRKHPSSDDGLEEFGLFLRGSLEDGTIDVEALGVRERWMGLRRSDREELDELRSLQTQDVVPILFAFIPTERFRA